MKQPLVAVALIYGAGVILGHLVAAPLLPAFLVALVVSLAALTLSRVRVWLMALSVFLFGWLNITTRTAAVSPIDLRTIVPEHSTLLTVRGRIDETPSERLGLRSGVEASHTLAVIEVEAIQLPRGEWQPAFGRVMSRTEGTLPAAFVEGQRVEINGIAGEPAPPIAEGVFDYARYLNSRGIYRELKIESTREWKVAGPELRAPLSQRFRTWAQRTLARGLPAPDESLRLQWAMLLGWQTALTAEVSEPFMRSGTMHIFAISGLHIALIAGIFLALLRAAMVPRLICGLLVIGIIWFYTGATGWQASAIRSTVMMTVIIVGWMWKRPNNLLNSLAVAACIILVWQPEQLFQASFQLSFFVVLSIALLSPPLEKLKQRWFKLDPLLPNHLRPRWQRFGITLGDLIWKGLATSLAAFIGSMPLIAYYFHLFTPGSLLANLVVVPVSSLALMSGLGALVTGDWLPFCTEWFNNSGWAFMRLMIWLSERAAAAPAAWWYVRGPGPVLFFLYYGLLIAGCAGWFAKKYLRCGIIAGAIALGTFWFVGHQCERAWHRITVLPFSTAHAVCVQPARGAREWLIDCGERGAIDFTLKPFLQANGFNDIAHLVLTHGDVRYMGGAVRLHEIFPVRDTCISPTLFRSSRYREIVSDLEIKSRLQRSATNGFSSPPWQVLHPASTDRFALAEDGAVVALGTFDGVRVLLVANLGKVGQNAVLIRHPELRADIVVTGLPENNEPLVSAWLEVLRPKLIIAADSETPTRRATPALLARLRRSGAEVISTRAAGAVTLSIKDHAWRMKTARPIAALDEKNEMQRE